MLGCVMLWSLISALAQAAPPPTEEDYYRLITIASAEAATDSRSTRWKPAPSGVPLEVSGLVPLDAERVAVAIRKGEIWILDQVQEDPPRNVTYHRFAAGLHEPLGLWPTADGFLVAQRAELTHVRDTDGDGEADEYLAAAQGWGVSGNYHEYAYGPKADPQGQLWLTLNIGMGLTPEQRTRLGAGSARRSAQGDWRGWALKISPEGRLEPVAPGMRSPSGLGANLAGDMFFTDQQGNWVPAGSLHHLRPGVFYGHPDSLGSLELPDAPPLEIGPIPAGRPYPDAIRACPALVPPAVWFPYRKAGQSSTDIACDTSGGKFGPFAGQLFVGEFTLAGVQRVYLERVNGQYQGACFPFREGFASAVIRLAFSPDGSLLAGLSNRGWSSLGQAAYGLERLVWTGQTPFEIQEMRAAPDGFVLRFTLPVARATAESFESYRLESYTYYYHEPYGSDEIQRQELHVTSARVSDDGREVHLQVPGLRQYFVHELRAPGIRSQDGLPLLHPVAFYTLNEIPPPAP